jgi:O-antigen/teichoic acid export membrane protein
VVPLRRGAGSLTRRILAFAGVPFLSLLAPFLFLPLLARLAGADAWVAIALGQSVGGFAALAASLGYATIAPPTVAVASAERRQRIVATSLHVRFPVFVVASAVAVVVAAALAPPDHRPEASAMAGAMSLSALALTWYWVGVGRALPILWTEVIPRIVATLIATGILLAGGGVIWYPVLLIVAMIAGPAAVYGRVGGMQLLRAERAEIAAVIRTHPPAMIAETAAGAYNALAVTLVTAVAPIVQAARYVAGDKAYRIGQYTASSLGNALQGWVAEVTADRAELGRRLRLAVLLHVALGGLGLLGFALFGLAITRLLFGSEVAIDEFTAIGFGIATLGIALGTAFGRLGLVTLGARTSYMTCVLIASALGVVSLLVGGSLWGAPGAAWALGSAELFSSMLQGTVLLVRWRRRAPEPVR